LYAVLREVKDGVLSEHEAIERLERRPLGMDRMDPESKLLLVMDVGPRTLAMATGGASCHEILAPPVGPCGRPMASRIRDCAADPFGDWMQPERRQAQGPRPKARWRPLPQLLYAQVVKSYRRRRIVACETPLVFAAMARVKQVFGGRGWQINTAFVERLNLDIPSARRRGGATGQHAVPGRRRLTAAAGGVPDLSQLCLAPRQLASAAADTRSTHGRGSARLGRPCTPAMAAGLTDHVWSLQEVAAPG